MDIGRGTPEILVVDAESRKPVGALATSFEMGVPQALTPFTRLCQERTDAW